MHAFGRMRRVFFFMAPSIPSGIPDRLIAGTTWRWTVSFAEFPPSEGWVVSYALRGVGELNTKSSEVVQDGSQWTVTIGADREPIKPGLYTWAAYVTGVGAYAGQVYRAATGVVLIEPDVASAAAGDLQTFAEQALALIEAKILERIEVDMSGYTFAQKQAIREDLTTLQRMRAQLKAELQSKRFGGRLPPYVVQFARA